jgi:hypothetical protein
MSENTTYITTKAIHHGHKLNLAPTSATRPAMLYTVRGQFSEELVKWPPRYRSHDVFVCFDEKPINLKQLSEAIEQTTQRLFDSMVTRTRLRTYR